MEYMCMFTDMVNLLEWCFRPAAPTASWWHGEVQPRHVHAFLVSICVHKSMVSKVHANDPEINIESPSHPTFFLMANDSPGKKLFAKEFLDSIDVSIIVFWNQISVYRIFLILALRGWGFGQHHEFRSTRSAVSGSRWDVALHWLQLGAIGLGPHHGSWWKSGDHRQWHLNTQYNSNM